MFEAWMAELTERVVSNPRWVAECIVTLFLGNAVALFVAFSRTRELYRRVRELESHHRQPHYDCVVDERWGMRNV